MIDRRLSNRTRFWCGIIVVAWVIFVCHTLGTAAMQTFPRDSQTVSNGSSASSVDVLAERVQGLQDKIRTIDDMRAQVVALQVQQATVTAELSDFIKSTSAAADDASATRRLAVATLLGMLLQVLYQGFQIVRKARQ